METNSVRLRRAFTEAAQFVAVLADQVESSQWSEPAVGNWTVRELVVHASRAASTITTYATVPAQRTLESSADYYLAVLLGEGVHESVAERTRVQAAEVTQPMPEYLRLTFAEAEETLQRTPAHQVLGTLAGGITLEDYLPTRVVELVVHGIDLAGAIGVRPEVPSTAMRVTLEALADLTVRRPAALDPIDLVKAMTGRGTFPEGSNLLG